VNDDFAPTPVVDMWDETPSLCTLRLDLGARRVSHTRPGQVVRLRANGHGDAYFAVASAPAPDGHADLLLKRGSPLPDAVIAAAQARTPIEMTSVFGRGFPLDAAQGHDLLLFAAGSGISPIRSLVQHVLARRADYGRAALFYGQRGHEDFAYLREHAGWHAAGVRVVLVASQAHDSWSGPRGYVQDVAHSLGFLDADPRRATAYLCGMKDMVSGVREVLTRAGVPVERIFQNF
jgi:NAD(P)H-flavin reductase